MRSRQIAMQIIDAVAVAEPEPRPGDPRDNVPSVADLEVLADDVPDRLEPPAARDVDDGAVVQRRYHRLVHRGQDRVLVLDFHRIGERKELLVDGGVKLVGAATRG